MMLTPAAPWVILATACGGGQRPLQCPSNDPTASGFKEEKSYEYFDVVGSTPNDANDSARARRPFKSQYVEAMANTEGQLCARSFYRLDDKGCRVEIIELVHQARITLPRWVNVPAQYVEWNRKSSARLAAHEEGHFAINAAAARELYQALLAVPPAPTCETLQAEVQKVSDRFREETVKRNAEYDAATKHGTVDPPVAASTTP